MDQSQAKDRFFHAVLYNDLRQVDQMLKSGFDVSVVNSDDYTPLMIASEESDTTSSIDMIKLLLKGGADINQQNKDGDTALQLAVLFGNEDDGSSPETVKMLIEAGADINMVDSRKNSSLMLASESGPIEAVRILLEANSDINLQNIDNETALMLASKLIDNGSSIEIVKMLLKAGANINLLNYYNQTAYDLCPNIECKQLIGNYEKNKYLQVTDKPRNLAEKRVLDLFSKELRPSMIMRFDRDKICQKLNNTQNIGTLWAMAELLGLSNITDLTKTQLCNIISSKLIGDVVPLRWGNPRYN